MKSNFYFIFSLLLWLIIIVGFSDNWLYDVGQESNSMPKFIIHGLLTFSWFSLLVIQTGLIKKKNINLHMSLGIAGMVIVTGLIISTGFIYVTGFLKRGYLAPISQINIVSLIVFTIFIVLGFSYRKKNSATHKRFMLVGTLLIMMPAIDRFASKFFEELPLFLLPWFITYFILFGLLFWHDRKTFKKIKKQSWIALVLWFSDVVYLLISLK